MNNGYTPQKTPDGKYVAFLLSLSQCHVCKNDMVRKVKDYSESPFPLWYALTFEAQAARVNLGIQSSVQVDGRHICLDCQKAGKATFLCKLCEERKGVDMIQVEFGDSSDFLCSTCYETVSAKVWDEKTDELLNDHRYDFD